MVSPSSEAVSSPCHHAEEVFARAERFSRDHRVPFTPMRRRVLGELAAAHQPLTAYDLVERLGREKRIAPVQIYRSLEFLLSAGVVHRLATRGAFVACDHEHAPSETVVFLVCGDCGNVAEVASPVVGHGLEGAAAATGFETRSRVVEVEGRCASCQAQA